MDIRVVFVIRRNRVMKLTLVFEDVEYMRALADAIARLDSRIYVELGRIDSSLSIMPGNVVLTDINPDSFDPKLLSSLRRKIIFVGSDTGELNNSDESRPFVLNKYDTVSSIVAEIGFITGENRGCSLQNQGHVRELITVFCDGNNLGAVSFARRLAQQVVYRTGDEVAIIPLTRFTGWNNGSVRKGTVRKLLYYLDNNLDFGINLMFRDDEAGAGCFIQDSDINPLSDVGLDILRRIISVAAGAKYGRIVLVCGDCLCERTKILASESNAVFWLSETGCDEVYQMLKNILDESSDRELIHIETARLGVPVDVWIDDYCIERYKK